MKVTLDAVTGELLIDFTAPADTRTPVERHARRLPELSAQAKATLARCCSRCGNPASGPGMVCPLRGCREASDG